MNMKKFYILLLLSIVYSQSVLAYGFDSKFKSTIESYDGRTLKLKVSEASTSFPEGAVLVAKELEHNPRKHFLRDEKINFEFYEVILPDGHKEKLQQSFSLRPRSWMSARQAGNAAIVTTGGVLALTIDMLVVGLPVVRGGKAIWEAAWEAKEARHGEKVKSAAKGFLTGALFPLPELILKGKALDTHEGNIISVHKANKKGNVLGVVIQKT